MSRIKKQKMTHNQILVLTKQGGVKDISNWTYVKTVALSEDGKNRAGKNSNNITKMIFANVVTNEMKEIII